MPQRSFYNQATMSHQVELASLCHEDDNSFLEELHVIGPSNSPKQKNNKVQQVEKGKSDVGKKKKKQTDKDKIMKLMKRIEELEKKLETKNAINVYDLSDSDQTEKTRPKQKNVPNKDDKLQNTINKIKDLIISGTFGTFTSLCSEVDVNENLPSLKEHFDEMVKNEKKIKTVETTNNNTYYTTSIGQDYVKNFIRKENENSFANAKIAFDYIKDEMKEVGETISVNNLKTFVSKDSDITNKLNYWLKTKKIEQSVEEIRKLPNEDQQRILTFKTKSGTAKKKSIRTVALILLIRIETTLEEDLKRQGSISLQDLKNNLFLAKAFIFIRSFKKLKSGVNIQNEVIPNDLQLQQLLQDKESKEVYTKIKESLDTNIPPKELKVFTLNQLKKKVREKLNAKEKKEKSAINKKFNKLYTLMIATKELYEEKLEYENGKKIVIYVSSFENREACVAKGNSVKQSNIEKLKAKIKRENTKTAREEYKKREAKHENILKALFENIDLPTSKYKYEYLIDFFMFTHQFFRNSNKTYLQKTDIIDKCKTCYGSKTNFRSYVQELFKSDGNGIPTLENGEYSIKSNQISIYYLTPYYLQKDKTMLKTFNDVRLRFQSIKQQNGKTAIQAFNMANKGSVENDSPQMLYATKPNFPDISFFKHNDFIFQDETSSKNYFDIIYKKEKAQENIKEYLKTYSITLNNNN